MKSGQNWLWIVLSLGPIAAGCGSESILPSEPNRGLGLSHAALSPEGFDAAGARQGAPHSVRRFWPNTDGNAWSFDYQRHLAAPMIPALEGLEAVPAAALDYRDLERRLLMELPAPFPSDEPTVGNFRMAFDGLIGTPYAGPKQKLATSFNPTARVRADGPTPLMRRIYVARPDLRSRMAAEGLVPQDYSPEEAVANLGPILVDPGLDHHYFEQQDSWMGYYGDLNADSSFTVLKAPLTPGAEFRHQLVPDLADDIWEYGWVVGKRQVETPAGTFRHALRAVYFFDFGPYTYVGNDGKPHTFRSFSIAMLNLVPDVGPVWQRSIDFLSPPIPELNIETGVLFDEMRLLDYDVASSAVIADATDSADLLRMVGR